MSQLDITVWPNDHQYTDMITRSLTTMRWKFDGKEKTIAQFNLFPALMVRREEKELLIKELKKYRLPESTDFEKLSKRRFNIGTFEAEPQFSLHVIPDIETDDFEAFQEFTDQYGGMFLKSYPSYGIDLNKITFKLEHKAIKLKDQIDQIGTVQIYSESLALLFLRDLKAMSRHIIALSNGEDETKPWKEAGYDIPKGKDGLVHIRTLLKTRLDLGLSQFSMFSVFQDRIGNEQDEFDQRGLVSSSIYSIICYQLYTYHQQHRPISRCAFESCGMYFSTTEGYGSVRSNRSNTKFCSQRCARNASQKRYRERKK